MIPEEARVLLASENKLSRSVVKTILVNIGFNEVTTAVNYEEIEEGLVSLSPDMLIFDSSYSLEKMYSLIKKIRHSEFELNPFMTIIALSDGPTEELMEGVLDNGVDDILTKPYSTGQFLERITVLIEDRKPFVVTNDYIGPDRRTKERVAEGEYEGEIEGEVISLIKVPNALQVLSNNKMNREKFDETVKKVSDEINILKLERNGVQVTWLVTHVLAGYPKDVNEGLGPKVIEHLIRLQDVMNESGYRLVDTPFSHVTNICEALMRLSEKMLKEPEKVIEKDRKLLAELANAFRISFKEINSGEIAMHILNATAKSLE